jgi:murein peptide amidase A
MSAVLCSDRKHVPGENTCASAASIRSSEPPRTRNRNLHMRPLRCVGSRCYLIALACVSGLVAGGCGDRPGRAAAGPAAAGPTQQTTAHQPPPSPQLVHRSKLIGRSVLGRPIRVIESGNPTSPQTLLVIGCIHGTEQAGTAVTRRLIAGPAPAAAHVWILNYINPDGAAVGSRVNAHGVDLNRNFPSHWRHIGVQGDLQYSGSRPASEPETRIAIRLIERIRPTVTIWFHQPVGIVRAFAHSVPVARRFARLTGLPFRRLPWPSGSATNWQNHRFHSAAAFVVELPPGSLSGAATARYVRAILTLAR